VTDLDGNRVSASVSILVSSPKPVISKLSLKPQSFLAAPKGPSTISGRSKFGTVISYRDSQASRTTFTVFRKAAGVRKGRGCVAPPRRRGKSHPRTCTRYVRVGSFGHTDRVGANSLRFMGRVGGHRLAPGAYRQQLVPSASRSVGAAVLAAFTVKGA
jgi:hypothetical protein